MTLPLPARPDPTPAAPPRLPRAGGTFDRANCDPEYPDVDSIDDDGGTLDLTGGEAIGILRSRLTATTLSAPIATTIDIQDAVFTDVDLTARRIESAIRVRFVRCRLGGVDFGAVRLRDVVFEDCLLDMASLRSASIERVEIRGGRMDGADFSSSTLTDVTIANVGFSEVVFDKTRLTRVDVRAADLTEVYDPTVLAGATITDVQAVTLAARLARAVGLWISAD